MSLERFYATLGVGGLFEATTNPSALRGEGLAALEAPDVQPPGDPVNLVEPK